MANIADLAKVTNLDFWKIARKASPTFASHTAEGTADLFTERGYEALTRNDLNVVNEFVEISLRVALQKIDVSRARNPFVDKGLVQVYETPNGGFVQRLAINSIKPVSPQYKGLKNYDTTDPFQFRKPQTSERFFQQNFDYQSFISIQDFQIKTVFLSENGVGQWIAGVLEALRNGYTIQEYENTLECLNAAIHSDTYTPQDTQVISLGSWTGEGTADELKSFILTAKNIASAMEATPQTSAYNALKFASVKDVSDHVMLVRPGLRNRIQVELEVGAFNPDRLTMPWEIVEVDNFGGLEAYAEATFDTRLYPVYDQKGVQIGWNEKEGQSEVTVAEGAAFFKDPNEQVIAIIAQKGLIFENSQNPYTVTPAYSAPGMYTTYWANRPNNAIVFDPIYNMVMITKPNA